MEKCAHVQWTLGAGEGGVPCAGTRTAAKASTGCSVTHVPPCTDHPCHRLCTTRWSCTVRAFKHSWELSIFPSSAPFKHFPPHPFKQTFPSLVYLPFKNLLHRINFSFCTSSSPDESLSGSITSRCTQPQMAYE